MAEANEAINITSNKIDVSTQSKPDEAFWTVADSFINTANEQNKTIERSTVAAGFLYAAARFNAFVIASQCGDKQAFMNEKAAAIDYFVNQYKIGLTENIADYEANFEQYVSNQPEV